MEVNVPLGTPVIKNIDGSLLDDSSSELMDGYLDEEGNINSRPGLLLGGRLNNSSAIDGIYWWGDLGRVMMVSGGRVWSLNSGFSGTDLTAGSPTITMASGTRATFANDTTRLFIANGGRIVQSDGNTLIYIADGDAPTAVTHIVYVDGYLIANLVGSNRFYWATLEDPTTWNPLDFASAIGNTDLTVGIYEFQKEIYIFGKRSLEIWENDGFKSVGCIAPYSVVKTNNGILWLSDRKRFVRFSGGDVEDIGTPYDKVIDTFNDVSDCLADRIDIVGRAFYTFAFPSEERTIYYNETNNNWGEFGWWDLTGATYRRFLGNCHVFVPDWNQHIWGTREADGALYKMSAEYLTDSGNPIRMRRVTGNISYGSNKLKRSNQLIIRAKRGSVLTDIDPKMTMRFNDEGNGWSNEIELSLGKTGDYRNFICKQNLGSYRTRQYEFVATDAAGVGFGHAKEDIYVGAF